MVCGDNVVGAKRVPTSRDYIAGMFDGDVMFISIRFMIIYRIKKWMMIDILCSYYAYIILLFYFLCFL